MRITNATFEGSLIVECTLNGVDVFYYNGKDQTQRFTSGIIPLPPIARVLHFAIEKYQEGYYDSTGKKHHSGKLRRSDISH